MAIDCLNPPCSPQLPISSIVNIFGAPTVADNTDCSMNLLYLVDDEGLIDQFDETSEPLFTTTDRILQLGSFDEVKLHFSPCSRTYWELQKFFSWEVGELQRPPTITLGYFDSSSETMLEALEDISKCFDCYNVVSHITYDKDGAPLFDTTESVDIAEWTSLDRTKFSVIPTVDYEATASQLKANDYDYSASVILNDVCTPELDEDCLETDVMLDTYDVNHLGLAAVLTSMSSTSADYSFTSKFTPKNGAFGNLATSQFDLATTRDATGVNPFNGGVDALSAYHANVYHNVGGTDMFMEGLTSTGRYIDEIIHRIHIQETIEKDIFALFRNNNSVALSDLSRLQNTLSVTVRGLASQGLIATTSKAIDVDDVLDKTGLSEDNIYLEGDGFVILNYATTPANINSRISPTFIICYVRPGSTHFASIGLCQSEISEV
ncbi:hypothetical protein N9043_01125 [bacterium]|nr:hypothetical protein [bacterium]